MSYKVNDGLGYVPNKYVDENEFISMNMENTPLPEYDSIKDKIPQPFWENHKDTIDCYYKSWEIAFRNIRKPTLKNGFVSNYIDAAFNGDIFMWDSVFMLMFGKYGDRVFKFQHTLDNFYAKQHKDGFICREIIEENGEDLFFRMDPVSTGPNILAWCEWEYYKIFFNKERIRKIFPVLLAYHLWLKEYRTWPDGSYWTSGWGCGMDNSTRLQKQYDVQYSHGHQIWVDATIQQYLNINILEKMARICNRESDILILRDEKKMLYNIINNKLWDEETSFYYDCWKNNKLNGVKTVAAYWALLGEVVPENRAESFIGHLSNENEFKRLHRVPTLSADDKSYVSVGGGYWRGGVWAPTNYMILKGLEKYKKYDLAFEIAYNHIINITKVYNKTNTVWENYSPDTIDRGNQSRGDFVGWTGASTIAVLIENVLGISSDCENNELIWHINLTDEHGINLYPFGKDGVLNLKCDKRSSMVEEPHITVKSNCDLRLKVFWKGGTKNIDVYAQ